MPLRKFRKVYAYVKVDYTNKDEVLQKQTEIGNTL